MLKLSNYIVRMVLPFIVLVLLLLAAMPAAQPAQAQSDQYIADPFISYYWRYSGDESLGLVQSNMMTVDGYAVQYFEKGRLEAHGTDGVTYGNLTTELMQNAPAMQFAGTHLTYGDIYRYTYSKFMPPEGFTGGTMEVEGGVFVPYDNALNPAPGYIVPPYFWNYINRADMFPRGWMHGVGLPMTDIFEVEIVRDGVTETLTVQAFERTILSYNAEQGVVQSADLGTDMLLSMGETPLYLQPTRPTGPKRIEVDLARQWLYAYEGDYMVYDIPVSTGKPGWETPTGTFSIFSKQELTDMQGDVAGESWYVPNVPHAMYFASGGYAIHGTYWHNSFGTGARLSHGCVNLPVDGAAALYYWAPMGTPVIVY